MKNITLFNQVNLLQSFCKRMATATTSCVHSYKRYYLLLTILLFVGVNNAWAARTFKSGEKIYFKDAKDKNLDNKTWKVSDGNIYAYFWNNSENAWSSYGNLVSGSWNAENAIYEFTVPGSGKTYTKMLFTRGTGTGFGSQKWNQTGDQTPNDGQNIFYISSGTWGAYAKNGAIVGTMNNWNPDTNPLSSNKVTISLNYTSATSYDFKVLYGETYYGTTNAISGTVSNQVFSTSGNNCTLNLVVASTAQNYTFTWDNTNKKLSVTYPTSYTVTYSRVPTAAANAPTTTPSVISGSLVASGTSVKFTAKAAKTGYTWKGWYDNDKGTGNALSTNLAYTCSITANTTIYAVYTANTYTVKFDANGGTGTMSNQNFTYGTAQNLTANTFTRTGYSFAGWNTVANGSGTSYDDEKNVKNLTTENGATITLYAQWFELVETQLQWSEDSYTATMEADNDFPDLTILPNDFAGELTYQSSNPAVATIAADGTITLIGTGTTTITASIAEDDTYLAASDSYELTVAASNCKWVEVTDNTTLEDGDEVVITMTLPLGTSYALPNDVETNAVPSVQTVDIKDNSIKIVSNSIIWIINKEGDNLTFESYQNKNNFLTCNNADAGVRVNTGTNKIFVVDDTYGYLKNTNHNRYLGVHNENLIWYSYALTDAGKFPARIAGQTLKLYKKVCLDENNYWVTWNAGEGQFEDGKSTKIEHYQEGAEITPPTPTRIGYNLTGWSPILEATMLAQNMTYTAQWELKTTTITLAHQGGTGGTEITATYSQPMPPITPPIRTGYDFQGYFSSNGGTGTKYYNADGTSATTWDQEAETFTLIAYWTAKTTTVSFDQNGGTGGQTDAKTATYDQPMPTPITVPTKEGHTFLGYYDATTDGTQYYDAAGNSTKEWNKEDATFTLYAQWKVNQYTVTWYANEGNWHGSTASLVVSYDYGTTIEEPEDPVRGGWVFNGWDPTPAATMPAQNITYSAQWGKAYCENQYTFHTGTIDVWNNPTKQNCFERKEGTETEWQIVNYVVPAGNDHTHFLVAYSGWPQTDQGSLGGHSRSVTSTWSASMYLAPAMNFGSAENTPKVGHAAGAKGTLRIFDDSSWDNLCVGFIPDGYGITITGDTKNSSHAFHKTATDQMWETDVVTLPGVTNHKYAMGLATATEGTFVACDHTKAAENIAKMGVTGNVVYLKAEANWTDAGARFAACFMNSDKTEQTWVDMNKIQLQNAKNLYIATVPANQKYVIFCRMNGATTANNWDNKWNQTSDIELPTDGLANVYTTTSLDGNSCTYTSNKATPQTQQNGKFRMWDNSNNKNWYVHFVPYYLLNYDPNGGDGTMAPTEYNTEDTNKNVTVSDNGFTRTGYDFVSWNTKADGNGTTYQPDATYTMTQDAKLYAQWQAQTYNIIYRDQGGVDFSGEHGANHPTTHTYDKATSLVSPTRVGYTFDGWYTTSECDGEPITQLGATEYTTDVTLYAKWTFAMEYTITNTKTIFITSAKEQNIKATTPLTLEVSNMPVGTTIDISAPHITFYDEEKGNPVTQLTTKNNPETFSLAVAYTPEDENTTEQPTITLSVLAHEKTFANLISCRSLPATFAIVAKVGNLWYALPSQGLNSTDALVGYPVEVDNQNDPTAVTAVPENADWSLRQVYAASHSDALKDRFKQYGANIMFENNASPAKMLNASVSDNYLLTNAEYDNYKQSDNQGLYEWTPTTTDLETYTLTNAQRTDRTLNVSINNIFGVHYDNKATTEVRFLPIAQEANRYTPLALQVVEWKENSVVVMYNGDPAQTASVSVNGAAAQETSLSSASAQRDIAVYELAANDLATNPTQSLSITIGTEKAILPIPYIISGSKTDYDLLPGSSVSAKREAAKVSDLVILEEATLTAAGTNKNDPYKFRHVTIYGGGKLVIPENNSFGVASLTLRAGGITDAGDYDYVYPQFDLHGTFTNSAAKINYDYITDYEHWYHLVLPFDGDLGTIKYPTEFYGANVAANNTGSWQIKRYAGEIRATGNYNAWVDIETEGKTSTTAGQGYIFWGAPKKVSVNGGASTRQKWGIQRITMSVTAPNAMTAENGDKAISELSSYENVPHNSGKDNDQGWNLIGNPYMVNLTDMSTSGLHACKLVEAIDPVTGKWNGQWEWNDETNIRYLTIPSEHFDTYEAKTVSEAISANALVPGRAFFVQLDGEANGITFATANRASLMPALLAENSDKPVDIETGIILSNETLQDEVNFWIKDGKTNDYEYNADYPKTPNNNRFNIYGVHTNGDLSWVAINPLLATESMPIGYQVPAAGTYILSLSETYYSEDLEALYVTDHEMSPEVTVDLINAPYEFSVNQAETNNERFTISLKLKSENQGPTTGWENVDVGKDQSIKFIHQDRLYILRNGIIYDTTGQQIQTINK